MNASSCCNDKSSAPIKDEVCGMDLVPTDATLQIANKGTIHYFCSAACMDKFNAEPQKYTQPSMNPSV